MIEVSNLSKEFVLNRKQRKELNTLEKTALDVDNISFKWILITKFNSKSNAIKINRVD